MKSLFSFVVALLCASPFLAASQESINSRMNGFAEIPESERVALDSAIPGFSAENISEVVLTTPYTKAPENRLKLDEKRSVLRLDIEDRIDESNLELAPELYKTILKVVNNQAPELTSQNRLIYENAGIENFYVFANYRASQSSDHEPEWFVAVIPKNVLVTKIFFQTAWFRGGIGAHNQIRMELNQPVVGISQDAANNIVIFDSYEGRGDLIFSLQASRVEGGQQEWDPLKGILGEFGIVLQIIDSETMALNQIHESVVDELVVLDTSKAKNQKEKDKISKKTAAILKEAINLSDRTGNSSIYNSVFASCITYALKVLNAGFDGNIDTTWFNPYTVVANVKKATGATDSDDFEGLFNKTYRKLGESKGLRVLSHEMIKKDKPEIAKAVAAVQGPLLENVHFENIVRKLTLFIVNNQITYDQLSLVFNALNKPTGTIDLQNLKSNPEANAQLAEIRDEWNANMTKPISELRSLLQMLKSQD